MTTPMTATQIYQKALKTTSPGEIHFLMGQFNRCAGIDATSNKMFATLVARFNHMQISAQRTFFIEQIKCN